MFMLYSSTSHSSKTFAFWKYRRAYSTMVLNWCGHDYLKLSWALVKNTDSNSAGLCDGHELILLRAPLMILVYTNMWKPLLQWTLGFQTYFVRAQYSLHLYTNAHEWIQKWQLLFSKSINDGYSKGEHLWVQWH